MNIIETIRAEIERRKEKAAKRISKAKYNSVEMYFSRGELTALYELGAFLDTLPEQSVTDCHELDNHTIMEEIRKCGCNPNEFDVARHFFELGLNTRK